MTEETPANTPEPVTLPPMAPNTDDGGDPAPPAKGENRTDPVRQQVQQEMANYRKIVDDQLGGLRDQMSQLVEGVAREGALDTAAQVQEDMDEIDSLDDDDLVDVQTLKKMRQADRALIDRVDGIEAAINNDQSNRDFWASFAAKFPNVDGKGIWANIEAKAIAAGFNTPNEIRAYGHEEFNEEIAKAVSKTNKGSKYKGDSRSIAGAVTQTPGASTAAAANADTPTDIYGLPKLVE
jgi:hypothetical protein